MGKVGIFDSMHSTRMSTGGKGQVIPTCAKKECDGVEVELHSFLTSAPYTGKQSATCCSHFNPKSKSSCTH